MSSHEEEVAARETAPIAGEALNLPAKRKAKTLSKDTYDRYKSSKSMKGKANLPYRGPDLEKIRKQKLIKGYSDILEEIENEYSKDSAMHLYSVFLLHSRTKYLPAKKLTNWPLPLASVPVPTLSLEYVDENDIEGQLSPIPNSNIRRAVSRFSALKSENLFVEPRPEDFLEVNKRTQSQSQGNMYYEAPKMKSVGELNIMIDSIFRKKIHDKIHKYENSIKTSKDRNRSHVRPIVDPVIQMPNTLKSKIFSKLNQIVDNFIDERRSAKKIKRTNEFKNNWVDVMSYAEDTETLKRCKKLFDTFKLQPFKQEILQRMNLDMESEVQITESRTLTDPKEQDEDKDDENNDDDDDDDQVQQRKGEEEDDDDNDDDGIFENSNGDVYFFGTPSTDTTSKRLITKKLKLVDKDTRSPFAKHTAVAVKTAFLRGLHTSQLDQDYSRLRTDIMLKKESLNDAIDNQLPSYEQDLEQRPVSRFSTWNTLV